MSLIASLFNIQKICTSSVRCLVNVQESLYAGSVYNVMINYQQTRDYQMRKRRRTHPPIRWGPKREEFIKDHITRENKQFIREKIADDFAVTPGQSLLKEEPWPRAERSSDSMRTGLIARKIGIYPMWTKDGKRLLTTLLQILDNHVIKYYSPEEFAKNPASKWLRPKGKYGALIVGAEAADPQLFTPLYRGLFNEAGVMPKRKLTRFIVTADAAIQPGTPLTVNHFRVGDYVNVYGKTIGHGFQGGIVRWNFRGGPASHGSTKFHRRIGTIGTGRRMSRVWPGKKMPGHMGQERRTIKGLKIWRINTKHNVLWVQGPAVPGHVHHYVRIFDNREHMIDRETLPPFPTFYPEDDKGDIPEDILHKDLHDFSDESLTFAEEPEIIIEPLKVKGRRK